MCRVCPDQLDLMEGRASKEIHLMLVIDLEYPVDSFH